MRHAIVAWNRHCVTTSARTILRSRLLAGRDLYLHPSHQPGGPFAGRDLPLYARHTAGLSARYAVDRWTFNAELNAQSKQRSPGTPGTSGKPNPYVTQEDANGNLGDIPGFAILGLRTSYQASKELNNLRLTVGVKNVFDRRYFTRSTDNNGGGKYA